MARRWAEELAAWAIDPAILATAPESPYGFPPGLFGSGRGAAPTLDAVRGGLPGSVLDVGCGGGAGGGPAGAGGGVGGGPPPGVPGRVPAPPRAVPGRTPGG